MTAVQSDTSAGKKDIQSTVPAPAGPVKGMGSGEERAAANAYEYTESRSVVRMVDAAADLIRQRGEAAFAEFGQDDSRWHEGWYHYQWPVPGGLLPRWKSSYVRRVEAPSGRTYVVGSGVYNDRMERAFIVGSGIARHYHMNEEYSWVLSGALEYRLDDRTVVVRAGEIFVVPSNVPHAIVALEDSTCVDFFAPVREDWLKGEDQYLRKLH